MRALLLATLFAATPFTSASADTAANKALVAGVFQALEAGDVVALNRAFAPDGRNHIGPETRPRRGPHASFAEAAPFAGALSERRVTVFEMVAEGELVAVRSRLCGRHTLAPLLGVAQTDL